MFPPFTGRFSLFKRHHAVKLGASPHAAALGQASMVLNPESRGVHWGLEWGKHGSGAGCAGLPGQSGVMPVRGMLGSASSHYRVPVTMGFLGSSSRKGSVPLLPPRPQAGRPSLGPQNQLLGALRLQAPSSHPELPFCGWGGWEGWTPLRFPLLHFHLNTRHLRRLLRSGQGGAGRAGEGLAPPGGFNLYIGAGARRGGGCGRVPPCPHPAGRAGGSSSSSAEGTQPDSKCF